MNCPVCEGVSLVMSERSGIEIDYCPKFRGVWLDRGELDKIIERSVPQTSHQGANYGHHENDRKGYSQPYHQSHNHAPYGHDQGYYRKKKREGFLGELFDFD